jgi:hypothetical protein
MKYIMLYVGIAGYKRSGKDTVCQILIEELAKLNITAERRALADSLKEEVAKFLSEYFFQGYSYEQYLEWMQGQGENDRKEQFRLLMQWWGTEGRRMLIRDNYWLLELEKYANNVKSSVLIIPDVRFRNEVNLVKDHKGISVYVNRPGFGGENHPSEKDLDEYKDWNFPIDNSGDMEHLRNQVIELANLIHSSMVFEKDVADTTKFFRDTYELKPPFYDLETGEEVDSKLVEIEYKFIEGDGIIARGKINNKWFEGYVLKFNTINREHTIFSSDGFKDKF